MLIVIGRNLALPLLGYLPKGSATAAENSNTGSFFYRIFSIHEIERDPLLRWFGGAILLGFLSTFKYWQPLTTSTTQGVEWNIFSCWPFFQDCTQLIFLEGYPFGYTQMTAFMLLFALIIVATLGLITGRYVLSHASILLLFIAKIYFNLLLYSYSGNYDYYHTTFCLVYLFLPHKRFFGSLSVAMFYTLSTVAKIHPSWTLGLYFTAMEPGMPLFPKAMVPFLTNFVIFMEMIMAWFLFSQRVWLQRLVFGFYVIFHLYSGTIVGYHYPSIVMPPLMIFFGPWARPFPAVPLDRRSLAGWGLMAALWGVQLISVMIPGDAKLTLEGNNFGLFMFEANHQCLTVFLDENGKTLQGRVNRRARYRCDPWQYLQTAQRQFCHGKEQPPRISFNMSHSINGGPFYEIVDEPDMCALTYQPFRHNEWIRDASRARIVGRPTMNRYD